MIRFGRLLTLACIALLTAAGARADAPLSFHYQGVLANQDGNRRNGSFDMVFEVYGQASGGSALFADTRTGASRVAVVNGVFAVEVGEGALSGQPLATAISSGDDRWLQVTVNGIPLLPRKKLTAAPYASAVRADGVTSAAFLPSAVGSPELATGAVTTSRLADGAVTNAHVTGVDWSKITGLPSSLGSPAAALNGTVVQSVASTITFSAAPFSFFVPGAAPARADISLDTATVTLQSNAFNAAGRLLLLDASGLVPSAQVSGVYAGVTGLGTVAQGVWNGSLLDVAHGGTGASSAAGARASLGTAASTAAFSAGAGLTGGGAFGADVPLDVNTAAISGGCNAAGQKLVWSSTTLRMECGVDSDVDTIAMAGDVTAVNQTTATVVRLQGRSVAATAPSSGQALKWDQALGRWAPQNEDTSTVSGSGTPGRFARWLTASTLGSMPTISTAPSGVAVSGVLAVSGAIVGPGVTSGVNPGHTHTAYSLTNHTHSTDDITTGLLPTEHGGTGMGSFIPAAYLRASSTGSWEWRTPAQVLTDIIASPLVHSHTTTLPLGFDNYLARFNGDSGYDRSLIYQDDAGKLGIGTTSPQAPLHVLGSYSSAFASVSADQTMDSLRITGGQTGLEILCQWPACGYNTIAFNFNDSSIPDTPLTRRTFYSTVSGAGTLTGVQIRVHGDGDDTVGYGAEGYILSYDVSTLNRGAYGRAYGGTGTKYGLYAEATGPGDFNMGVDGMAPTGGSNFAGYFQGNVNVNGMLVKVGPPGTFDIVHPDPAKAAGGWRLRHAFVESPTRGDNMYHWTVLVKGGKAEITLPAYFRHLNENVQVWVAPEGHFGRGAGDVDEKGERVEVIADKDGEYNVLVIGTRKDEDAKRLFDPKGVEYRP